MPAFVSFGIGPSSGNYATPLSYVHILPLHGIGLYLRVKGSQELLGTGNPDGTDLAFVILAPTEQDSTCDEQAVIQQNRYGMPETQLRKVSGTFIFPFNDFEAMAPALDVIDTYELVGAQIYLEAQAGQAAGGYMSVDLGAIPDADEPSSAAWLGCSWGWNQAEFRPRLQVNLQAMLRIGEVAYQLT